MADPRFQTRTIDFSPESERELGIDVTDSSAAQGHEPPSRHPATPPVRPQFAGSSPSKCLAGAGSDKFKAIDPDKNTDDIYGQSLFIRCE